MSQMTDFKEVDREVFTASFDDGLVDIFIAGFLLMFVIVLYLSVFMGDFWSSFVFLPFLGALYLCLRWIRKNLVEPRVGVVKFGVSRKRRLTIFTWVMLALNLIFFLLGMLAFLMPLDSKPTIPLIMSVIWLIVFSTAGYFLDLPRFYLYGLMLALAPLVGEWLYNNHNFTHHGFPVVFGFCSLVFLLVGVVKLVTLLHNNPLPEEELLP